MFLISWVGQSTKSSTHEYVRRLQTTKFLPQEIKCFHSTQYYTTSTEQMKLKLTENKQNCQWRQNCLDKEFNITFFKCRWILLELIIAFKKDNFETSTIEHLSAYESDIIVTCLHVWNWACGDCEHAVSWTARAGEVCRTWPGGAHGPQALHAAIGGPERRGGLGSGRMENRTSTGNSPAPSWNWSSLKYIYLV